MPLPPLPANNTSRAFIKYTTGRVQHEFTYRFSSELAPEDTLNWLDDLLGVLQSTLPTTWALVGAEWQQNGSIVRLPFSLGTLQGFEGTEAAAFPLQQEPGQWTFVGRGEFTGRRVRIGFFGISATPPATYRLTGAGKPAWADAVLLQLASDPSIGITVGLDRPFWYDYVNFNYNSYWETEARG